MILRTISLSLGLLIRYYALAVLGVVALAAILLFVSAALGGCRSPETQAASAEVGRIWSEINADGVVTAEEGATYVQAVEAWRALELQEGATTDFWTQMAAYFGGPLAAGAVYYLRNRREVKLWGPPVLPPPA